MTASEARIDPRVVRSRELILDAALAHFLDRGFLDATVDVVAAEAGVAKRTVYNLFGSKDELFRAVMQWATDTAERFVVERVDQPLGARDTDGGGTSAAEPGRDGPGAAGPDGGLAVDPDGGDLVGELRELAIRHARAVVNRRVIAVRRLLLGEAHRFPDLAVAYFERVPSAVLAAIARRLERYAAVGLLAVPDARVAADHFAYLVLGAALDRALFEGQPPPAGELDAAAVAGADVFLRAYRTTTD